VTDLDEELAAFASNRKLTYGRYADDLAFSGDALAHEHEVAHIVRRFGFELRRGSFAVQRRSAGQFVTGLNVTGAKPRIPRAIRRQILACLRFGSKYGVRAHLTKCDHRMAQSPDEYVRYLNLDFASRG